MAGLTQLFLDKNFGSVATLRKDGTAQVTPVWLDYEGGEILLNGVETYPYRRASERRVIVRIRPERVDAYNV